jgi:hypothetical protein
MPYTENAFVHNARSLHALVIRLAHSASSRVVGALAEARPLLDVSDRRIEMISRKICERGRRTVTINKGHYPQWLVIQSEHQSSKSSISRQKSPWL